MAKVQRTMTVEVLIEAEEKHIERTVGFVKTSLKGSCRNLNDGAVVIGLYENDRLVGLDVTGELSESSQEQVESIFGEVVAS